MVDSYKVSAAGDGDILIKSEKVLSYANAFYYTSVWVKSDFPPQDATLSVRYYDKDGTYLNGASTTFQTVQDAWILTTFVTESPDFSEEANLYVTIEDVVPNQVFYFTPATWSRYDFLLSQFTGDVEARIPQFMVEADRRQTAAPSRPLLRYLDILTKQISDVNDTTIDFDYVRWTDSLDGEPSDSTLTDPFQALNEWLFWLAQQTGVRLSFSSTGLTTWDSFDDAGIDEWTEWEQDVVPGGFGADTTWTAIENFDVGQEDSFEAFRWQIYTGYNGVMSSTPTTILDYTNYVLATDDPDPFLFIRKHYRTNPAQLGVVVNPLDDPDPTGSTLEDQLGRMAPASTNIEALFGVSRSALSLYDANDLFSTAINLAEGYNRIPAIETDDLVMNFVEDTMGTGRHITLVNTTAADLVEDEWWTGGGIARSRYFLIADLSGAYNVGHGLTSGFVEAETAAHASLQLTSNLDVRVLVSDLRPPVVGVGQSTRTIVQGDEWSLGITDTGHLSLTWEATSGTQVATSTAAFYNGGFPKWIHVILTANDGAGGHTVEFETAPTLYDEWEPLGDTYQGTGITDIAIVGGVGIKALSKDSALLDGANGVVCRILVGADDTTPVVDINFLDTSEPAIALGASSFNENATNELTVTVTSEDWSETEFNRSKWLLLNRVHDSDYFHFGASAYRENNSNPTDLGDILTVSGLNNENHTAVVTYYDSTSASVALGASTAFDLNSDDTEFGAQAIETIRIYDNSSSLVAQFNPSMFSIHNASAGASVNPGSVSIGADTFGASWDFTRGGSSAGAYYYEASSVIDRDTFMPIEGKGIVRYGAYGPGASVGSFSYAPAAFSAIYRRITPGNSMLVNNIESGNYGDIGWTMGTEGDLIVADVSNGRTQYRLSWDEVAANRFGAWNTLVLVFNPVGDQIELWVNGILVDSTDGFFPNQYVELIGGTTAIISNSPDLAQDFVIETQIRAFDYVDNSLPTEWEPIAEKPGGWQLAYDLATGVIRFQWESGGIQSVVTPIVFNPLDPPEDQIPWYEDNDWTTLQVLFEVNSNTTITVNAWNKETGEMAELHSEVVVGAFPIDSSASSIVLGSFEGGIYRFEMWDDLAQTNRVLGALFTDTETWNIHSISGLDQTGTSTITLGTGTSIERISEAEVLPPYYPIRVEIAETETMVSQIQFSQMAFYDHSLSEKDVSILVNENISTTSG
jgi:hypothetical protein